MLTLPILIVSLNLCIFIVGILLIIKILPSYRRLEIKWLLTFVASVCIISFCSLNVYILNSFEAKELFSRLRFIGLSIIAESWAFFLFLTFSRKKFLKSPFFTFPIITFSILTVIITLTPSLRDYLVYDFQKFEWHGVSLVTFKNGPWFIPHILLAYIFATASIAYVFFLIPFSKDSKRKQVTILSIGGIVGLASDVYCVYTDSPLRWAMLSSGAFLITEASIFYAIIRHGLLDLASVAKEHIFNSISDPLLILDQDTNLIDFNLSAKRYFRIQYKDLHTPLNKIEHFKNLDTQGTTEEWYCQEFCFQVVSESFKQHSGRILLFREITAQKEIELSLSGHLEFKARLLGMIAHDFSGMLSMQSYLSEKLEQKVSPELRAHAGALTNSAYASKDFMSNIMTWAKAQENRFIPIIRPYEINTLISSVIESLDNACKLQSIVINFSSNTKPFIMNGDAVMIESVIRNILANAVRASSTNQKIDVTLKKTETQALIKVKDQGVGISNKMLEVIANNSSDFLNNVDIRPQGSGLGLIIAKRFVSIHKGSLEFLSEEGRGTLVTLALPL